MTGSFKNRAITAALKLRARILSILKRRRPLPVSPRIDGKAFLFIGGLHRSGTSVLHRILREHPETSGFQDSGARQDEGQHLQSVFAAGEKYGGPGRFAFNIDSHLTESSALISNANRQTLLREWGAYLDLTRKVFLEKSPPNVVRSRFLQALLPDSCFVFLVRHPIAVSLASRKWSKTTILELMRHWQRAHEIMLADYEYLRSKMILRYEDLVESPDVWLGKICGLVDIAEFAPLERLENRNNKYFSIWVAEHSKDRILLEKQYPDILALAARFGYSFDDPFAMESSDFITSSNGT
jgi:hypothetical protein